MKTVRELQMAIEKLIIARNATQKTLTNFDKRIEKLERELEERREEKDVR